MALGIDISNYQGIPTASDAQALLAAGFTFAVVGLQDPDHGEGQAIALRAAGITCEDCYVENTSSPRIPAGMVRGWVAVEDGSGFTTADAVNGQLSWLQINGLQAGIYTSPVMLAKYGLTDAFDGVPRWYANYNGTAANVPGAVMTQYDVSPIPGVTFADTLDVDYRDDVAQEDEDSLANRTVVEGSQDIAIVNDVVAKALGDLVAGNQSGGVTAYVRRGPSVDLPAGEEELTIRVPAGTIPALA